MLLWIIFPITLSLVSFIGTWTVYGLAYYNKHVCSLSDWNWDNFCTLNISNGCCFVPTISASGMYAPENSLFTATINAGSFMFFLFCLFHHAHVIEKHECHTLLSKSALAFGVVATMGAFGAGNCNPAYLPLLHYFGAAISFTCICFYTLLLTILTRKCSLTGWEKILYPLRTVSTVIQIVVTLCYTALFIQYDFFYTHLAAVFEWLLSVNLQLFELSYAVEFCFFSSFMISNLISKREEEKSLILSMS